VDLVLVEEDSDDPLDGDAEEDAASAPTQILSGNEEEKEKKQNETEGMKKKERAGETDKNQYVQVG
jgi:hypothetical protein